MLHSAALPFPGMHACRAQDLTLRQLMTCAYACAEAADLVAVLEPPLEAAAYLRLLQALPGRATRGVAVAYVTPLELIDLKTMIALVPGAKVPILDASHRSLRCTC